MQNELKFARLAARIASPDSWVEAERTWPKQISVQVRLKDRKYVRVPLPGFVGPGYANTRVVFLGINPGNGLNFAHADAPLFNVHVPNIAHKPTVASFRALNRYLASVMPTWDIFSSIDFPRSFGLRIDDLAYSNVLLANAPDVNLVKPSVFKFSIQHFLDEWLELLDPKLIVVFGIGAGRHLERYWGSSHVGVPIHLVTHPMAMARKVAPAKFETELATAKRAVARLLKQRNY